MKTLLTMILLLLAANVDGQTRRFRWSEISCEFEGTFNSSKYSEARLRNTWKMIEPGGGYSIDTDATAWAHDDIAKLSLIDLEREYATKTAELRKLDIVPVPFFERYRQAKLKEMLQVYKLSRSTIRGYSNPAFLIEYQDAKACDAPYADPLINGGDQLLSAWRRVNEESRSKNSDPERLRRIFDEQYASPDRLKFARIEVMMFGWWNCANALIPYVEQDGSAEREFKKLFVRVRTIGCDEP